MPLAYDISNKIGPHHKLLTAAFFVGAAVLLLIFPSFDKRTEIEEHALIPGYADAGFHGPWTGRLKDTIKKIRKAESISSGLDTALLDADLPIHRYNFTALDGVQGSLVYTVAASSRGDSREAIVVLIATNWTARKGDVVQASWGLGVGVTLAQYLKQVKWLSKDVFFVFVDRALPYGAGARAWLRAYFGGSSAVRRGVLRQAIVLDTVNKPSSALCDVEGVNGMVPNQDVVNAYVVEANRNNVPVEHRMVWDSMLHHVRNGGVHSLHAPFLEAQVPAFTVRARRPADGAGGGEIEPDAMARSLEGIVRDFSNNLQQLHHSFNFYFFTSQQRHISSGLYLYPVFGMQLPLLSYLLASPPYRDIRSFLVGLGLNAALAGIAASPIFLLATAKGLGSQIQSTGLLAPPACERPSPLDADLRRWTAAIWLGSSVVAALPFMLALRQYAFKVYREGQDSPNAGDAGVTGGKNQDVRLPFPLWEAMHATSGFAFLVILAPLTIASWAIAVPLTVLIVPYLVLVRPFSLRHRPFRSLLLLCFVAGNLFLLLAPPTMRADLVGGVTGSFIAKCHAFLHDTIVQAVPREFRKYLPISLFDWLHRGTLTEAFGQDLLLGLFESARDFNCVGGLLFPMFCFCYWPFLLLLVLILLVLPAQRVVDDGLSLQQIRLFALFFLVLLGGAFVGAVWWRSTNSHGLGEMQW